MTDGQDSQRQEITDSSKFPSLSIALDELRQKYSIEQDRKSNIEVKIGAIIGIDAILVSIVGAFGSIHLLTKVVILLPALFSAGFALKTFNSRTYEKPGPEVDEIFSYARMDEASARKNFVQNYRQAVKHNARQNDRRMETLDTCFILTAVSLLLIVGSPLLDQLVRKILTYLVG